MTKRTVKGSRAKAEAAYDGAFNELIDETVRLYRRLSHVAEQVHNQGEMSGALRGMLRCLNREGPQTVPQLARSREVSRQHIQMLINRLEEEGYVALVENPAHRRSPLAKLTPRGSAAVEAMNSQEERLLSRADTGVSEAHMAEAAGTLRTIRQFFESDAWNRILKTVK
ncbi:MAG: MarR family transcriptional regulator [Blastocatellia bacterium]|nr:MarR family transcriptional regulator [Blastocatellia bacterium]